MRIGDRGEIAGDGSEIHVWGVGKKLKVVVSLNLEKLPPKFGWDSEESRVVEFA